MRCRVGFSRPFKLRGDPVPGDASLEHSLRRKNVDDTEAVMTEKPARKVPAVTVPAVFMHDLRNIVFAIQLTPLLLEKHREDQQRFEEICRVITRECETLAALIEGEFG